MRIVGAYAPAAVLSLLLAGVSAVIAQAPRRIDTAVALTQIVKRVDPVVPPEAVKAKVGGDVIADVIIGPAGNVSSVTILSGPAMLHAAAERAMRQWTFKPFLQGGRPGTVQVILEVRFPDPVKDEQARLMEAYRATRYECQRQLEAAAAKAEPACAEAVRGAEALPPDRVLERSHAVADHANSLFAAGRVREAIPEFERAIEIRAARAKGPDADTADMHQILAVLHQQLGEYTKADAEFTTAVAMYIAAQKRLPSESDRYAPRLQLALGRHAELKRLMGDAAAGLALEARAATVHTAAKSPVPAPPAPRVTRTAGDLRVTEPSDGRLTDDDVRQIRSALPAGEKPWRLDLLILTSSGGPVWRVEAFLTPDVATRSFRRGRFAVLTTASPPGVRETSRVWRRVHANFHYVQVAASGGDASAEEPIRVQAAPNSPPPADDELTGIVGMIRARAVPKPTDRLMSDVQPWPLTDIIVSNAGELRVRLSDPADEQRWQHALARHKGGKWAIVELQEIGSRPPR